jgi:hypothetical protein
MRTKGRLGEKPSEVRQDEIVCRRYSISFFAPEQRCCLFQRKRDHPSETPILTASASVCRSLAQSLQRAKNEIPGLHSNEKRPNAVPNI